MSDGYIRLSVAELQDLHLVHCISGMDEDCAAGGPAGAVETAITGYTEWNTDDAHPVSLGWDWQMHAQSEAIGLARVGPPSSNLMLQDAEHRDLGPQRTKLLLENFIDATRWQPVTLDYINKRYAY